MNLQITNGQHWNTREKKLAHSIDFYGSQSKSTKASKVNETVKYAEEQQ